VGREKALEMERRGGKRRSVLDFLLLDFRRAESFGVRDDVVSLVPRRIVPEVLCVSVYVRQSGRGHAIKGVDAIGKTFEELVDVVEFALPQTELLQHPLPMRPRVVVLGVL
jgi:hypothetical protein